MAVIRAVESYASAGSSPDLSGTPIGRRAGSDAYVSTAPSHGSRAVPEGGLPIPDSLALGEYGPSAFPSGAALDS